MRSYRAIPVPAGALQIGSIRAGMTAMHPRLRDPHLAAETYPVTLAGGGLRAFKTSLVKFACEESSLQGTLEAAGAEAALAGGLGECSAAGHNLTATADMHGCHYDVGLASAGPPYEAGLGVACEGEGEAIEYVAYLGGEPACVARIGPQPARPGIALASEGEGAERQISLEADVEGLHYTLSGAVCGGTPAAHADGILTGRTTLTGEGEEGEAVGVWAGGEG